MYYYKLLFKAQDVGDPDSNDTGAFAIHRYPQ